MDEDIVLQVRITEHLVNLLEGFQDVLVHVTAFPYMNKMLNGSWYVSLIHGCHQGEKMKIEGGGAEGTHQGQCQRLLLVKMNITKEP